MKMNYIDVTKNVKFGITRHNGHGGELKTAGNFRHQILTKIIGYTNNRQFPDENCDENRKIILRGQFILIDTLY